MGSCCTHCNAAEAHVSIMQVHTLPGMTALPLCLNRAPQLGYNPACPAAEQAAQGSPHLVQGYLPAACYKDYLALVGKPEAGVRGVGISANAARTLLKRQVRGKGSPTTCTTLAFTCA